MIFDIFMWECNNICFTHFSLWVENLFMKDVVEQMWVGTTLLIIWSSFFHLNILITGKPLPLWIDLEIFLCSYFFIIFSLIESLLNSSKLTWEKVEDLKKEHSYIAPDYASEVQIFQVACFCLLLCNRYLASWINWLSNCGDRKGIRKLKKRPGAGSFLGLPHLLKSSLQKKK